MANAYKLYRICEQCGGDGEIVVSNNQETPTNITIQCPGCKGAKVILYGYCTEAIFAIPEVPS